MRTASDAIKDGYRYIGSRSLSVGYPEKSYEVRRSLWGLEWYSLQKLIDANAVRTDKGNVVRVYLVGPDQDQDAYYGERELTLWLKPP